jgi:DNA polymerase I-like protein with 3'-5' exonuclease and polymerase domains
MNVEKKYITVLTFEEFKQLWDAIEQSEIAAVDTETTGLNIRKDKIIGASFSTKIGNGFYLPVLKYNRETDSLDEISIESKSCRELLQKVFQKLLDEDKKLIMHNGAFDTGIIYYDYGIDLLPNLWIETILAVHTVQEEGAFSFGTPFGLKSIAQMYQNELGLDVEQEANEEQIALKKSIAENNGQTTKSNFEIYKADFNILARYAAADTDLTLRVANLFMNRLREENLEKFFFEEEVMPVYKEVTVPMERRGIRLDLNLLEQTYKEIHDEMDSLKKEVLDYLTSKKEVMDWLFEQAYVKTFPPKRTGKFGKKLVEMFNVELPVDEKGPKLLKKFIEELPESSYKNFLLDGPESQHGIDEMDLLKVSIELWREKNDGNLINIQSKKHLSEIAFDYMKFKPKSTTKTGRPQFDDTFIEDISSEHTWAEKLRVYNRLVKINSTYVERLLREHQDGIFYPYFKQHGTVSGRYGSNLQQLPKPKEDGEGDPTVVKYNNRVRAFFIAREGYKFIDSDYESLEPHIFASISNDKNLQEIFNKGHDFYSTVAIRTEKLEGVSADKNAPNFLKKVDPVKRNKAKAYSLGIAYGMSPYALAMTLEVKDTEGEALHAAYLEGFPGVANWIEESRAFFREHGYIKNKVGRVRHLWRGKETYDLYGEQIMNFKFKRELEQAIGPEKVREHFLNYRNALNSSLNFQIQSLAASVVNRAALAINRKIKELGWDGQVIAQIHDQLIIEITQPLAQEASRVIQEIMETTTQLEGVTLKAPPEIANNFLDGH